MLGRLQRRSQLPLPQVRSNSQRHHVLSHSQKHLQRPSQREGILSIIPLPYSRVLFITNKPPRSPTPPCSRRHFLLQNLLQRPSEQQRSGALTPTNHINCDLCGPLHRRLQIRIKTQFARSISPLISPPRTPLSPSEMAG